MTISQRDRRQYLRSVYQIYEKDQSGLVPNRFFPTGSEPIPTSSRTAPTAPGQQNRLPGKCNMTVT